MNSLTKTINGAGISGRISALAGCVLAGLISINYAHGQTKDSIDAGQKWDAGTFPKTPNPELYNFRVSGNYRFFGTYNLNKSQYLLNERAKDTAISKTLFIGDDSQLPNLTLNFSGRPNKRASWGFDLYVFQFLDGNIRPTYGNGQVNSNNRPTIYTPRVGTRLGSNMGLLLGLNLYGNIETNLGVFSVKTGGIHWVSLSDLTLGAFTGYNRFILFERNPWDPINGSVKQRYSKYFEQGNINQDTRWGERAFVGTILEANDLPNNLKAKLLYGKTELNGGFLTIPNLTYGGQLRKDNKRGFIAINSLNNQTYTDSLNTKTIGFNLFTGQFNTRILPGLDLKIEAGSGRYLNPISNTKWGEAINVKLAATKPLIALATEIHFFRISPNVVNNNAIFWNVAVQEAGNQIPAGTVGSTSLLMPFASALTAVGQFTNNRQGLNINTEWSGKRLKMSLSNAISGEIQGITNMLSYSHPVNQFTRSRMWRWTFPTEVGPYSRYNKIFRDAYEKVNLMDTVAKRFNTIEFQLKSKIKLFYHDLFCTFLGNYSSVQNFWSPLTVFNENAYLRHYSSQLEMYYCFSKSAVFTQYFGYERIIANYMTETDAVTGRPRNQEGWGYALGFDFDLAKNTALYMRHRWYGFFDKSFQYDRWLGQETIVELKVSF